MSTQSLFVVQSELINNKVDIAVSHSIKEVVQQIIELRHEMHKEIGGLRQEMHKEIGGLRQEMHTEISHLKNEMNSRFSNLEKDMTAVKTRLGMRDQVTTQVRSHFIDYSFKAGWLISLTVLSATVSFVVAHIST